MSVAGCTSVFTSFSIFLMSVKTKATSQSSAERQQHHAGVILWSLDDPVSFLFFKD